MPYKDKEKQNAYNRMFYARNPHILKIATNKKRKLEIRVYIRAAKEGKPCLDCGIPYPPYVMDFDHRDKKTKICHPSRILFKGWCDERVQKELNKCDLVCANCHRLRTFERKDYLRD